ncbi:MAG TPA: hypothetical protein VLE44_01850 [Candidatus Saccharimonadales bacterium]|nr:hypothetical protein [Candidatus Saccharimonadales bacterium]
MKLRILALFFGFIFLFTFPSTAKAQGVTVGKLDLQCIGRGLSTYMNAVVSGAGNLPHIRLLSPVFNITDTTNPASEISNAMQSAGANFGGLSALAANTYVLNGVPGYKYYTDNFKSFADSVGKSVVFTEYGGEAAGLIKDYDSISKDPKIIGALFFNALNTNSRFSSYAIDAGTMRSLTVPDPSKAGVNSATYVTGGGTFPDAVKAYDSALGWDLEILNTPGDLQAAIDSARKAYANGLRPIFRLCASGNTCAFANPQVLVDFIKNLSGNQGITGDVWIVAGPNEPETEMWATPNCGGGSSVAPVAYDVSKEVPCNETVDKEFHSLRPYPASPCYKKVDETAMMCSNDLIVKKTFHVQPNGNCTAPDATGNFTCTYQYTGVQDTVSIDLTNAKLPVVGNTEDVPNATWTSPNTTANNLTAGQRVNNYISWYLNGVIDRAEEDFSSFDTNYLVNYSGPIKKLLPWASQIVDRLTSVANATQTKNNQKDPNDNTARHNEVVGCPWIDKLYGLGTVLPCYVSNDFVNGLIDSAKSGSITDQLAGLVLKATIQKNTNRLTDWNGWLPPLETDAKYTSLQDYWKAYLVWRGNVCTPNLLGTQFYFCAGLTNAFTVWSKLFPYTPLANTEDRVGTVFTDKNNPSTGLLDQSIQLKDGEGNGGTVTNVSFNPESTSHNLYFSHMQEDAELAKMLQGTVATKGDPKDPGNWEGQLQSAIKNQDAATPGNTYGCVKQEIISNPGDNLYGNLDRTKSDGTTDKKITGTLKYDATFTCQFKSQTGSKINDCDKDIYTSLSVYTKTPKSFEIWQRLVGCDPTDPNQPNCNGSGGESGIFKRFFPKPGQDSVLANIKDIPGATTVSYNSDADTKAGKTGQDGSTANIYFAHVGSLSEYFLQGIQTALRPKGVGDQQLSGQPIAGALQCKNLSDNVNIHRILNSPDAFISDKTIGLALQVAKATCTPAEILIGIMAKESRGLANGNTPYMGDPNEIGTRNCNSSNSNCGAYSFLNIDIRAQYQHRPDQMNSCLTSIGLPTGSVSDLPDLRKLGVSLCAAAVEFWSGATCSVARACAGGEQPLSSFTPGQIENSALEFHAKDCDPSQKGGNRDSDGAWKYYDQFIKIYASDVSRVRGQCSN